MAALNLGEDEKLPLRLNKPIQGRMFHRDNRLAGLWAITFDAPPTPLLR